MREGKLDGRARKPAIEADITRTCRIHIPAWSADRPPQWYEVGAGIISIPAALIGLAYSYILIKKTRLEARKVELEIAEKEEQIRTLTGRQPPESFAFASQEPSRIPLIGILLLRFALLYIVVVSWGLVEDVWQILFGGVIASAQSLWNISLSGWIVIPLIMVQKAPKVLFWVLFGAMALPLFKDINSALGLDVRHLFRIRREAGPYKEPLQNS